MTSYYSASYGGLKNWQAAADDAKECIRLDPSFIKGYYRLATAQIELKDFDGAMATVRQGQNLDAHNAPLMKLLKTIQRKVANANAAAQPRPNAPASLDEASARELQELQIQFSQTNREFQMVQAGLQSTRREQKLAEITMSELEHVKDNSKCYRSIGKMFMLSTRAEVDKYLNQKMEGEAKKEKDMTQKLEYLERKMKSQRHNMDELISANAEQR